MRAVAPVLLVTISALVSVAPAQESGSAPAAFRRWDGTKFRAATAAVQMAEPKAHIALDSPTRSAISGDARAAHLDLPADLLSTGEWVSLNDGRSAWRLAIDSAGAMLLRLHLTNADLSQGTLRIGGKRNSFVVTETEPAFWSQPAFGDAAWVEYTPNDATSRELPFALDQISHYFPSMPSSAKPEPLSPVAATNAQSAVSPLNPGNQAAACHLNATCFPEFRDASSGIALLLIEKAGQGYVCSGALISTTSGLFHPYLFTANHCLSSQSEAQDTIAVFFYEGELCNFPTGTVPIENVAFRANYLGGRGWDGGDWTLLELNDKPEKAQWLGWTTVELGKARPAIGIHHPGGDYKRISFGTRVDDDEFYIGDPNDGIYGAPGQYYKIEFAQGVVQGGSSGSPILNEHKQITGVASAAAYIEDDQACTRKPFEAFYGRFTMAYPHIRQYLEDFQPPRLTTPAPGSTLTSTTVDFAWYSGFGPTEYLLAIGTTPGASNLFYQNTGKETFRRVTRLPGNGSTIYVRLHYKFRDSWQFLDYTYRAHTDTGIKVNLNLVNRLLYPVAVKVNGQDFATVNASSTLQKQLVGTSTVEVTYEMIRPMLNGHPLGDEVKGWFPGTGAAQGTLNFTITNTSGTEPVFAPLVTNGTLEGLLLEVNSNTPDATRCDCTAAAGAQNFAFGYYKLKAASNVRTYRANSNYTGASIAQNGIAQFVQSGSGAMRLYFDRLP